MLFQNTEGLTKGTVQYYRHM